MKYKNHRPIGFTGEGDKFLKPLTKELKNILKKEINLLVYDTLKLPNDKLNKLAGIIIDFAEDLHNGIGIWRSYELYNTRFFNTPLPLLLYPGEKTTDEIFNIDRIHYLLWEIYGELKPEMLLAPQQRDIEQLSIIISEYLEDRFDTIPKDSGIKKFLESPNTEGGDVKRKLIWLGTQSYFFRLSFENYIKEYGGKHSIDLIDDFVCQHTTWWSGLGVIDILAEALKITDGQKKELLGWYERHFAYYQVLKIYEPMMTLLNLIDDKQYNVNVGKFANYFRVNDVILGSLIPWNSVWYWSGQQRNFKHLSSDQIMKFKSRFVAENPKIVYRYHKELASKVRKSAMRIYNDFVKYFGKDLVVFPDGLSMASELQKKDRAVFESNLSEKELKKFMKKYDLKNKSPRYSFPKELIEADYGIGVYCNPKLGQEIMLGFDDVINGLAKQGKYLSENEEEALIAFIDSESISPSFVSRVLRDYDSDSILTAFLIEDYDKTTAVEYLLRKYKGKYYRNFYPNISLQNL